MSDSGPDRDISRNDSEVKEGTFWLARNVLLRYLGFIYFWAFLIALHQNKRLFGKEGFLPNNASADLGYIINRLANADREGVINVPKIVYWFFKDNKQDENTLVFITHVGLALSLSLIIRGAANWVLMLCLWTIYHLLVDAGLQWYSFGWEFQLLETGFLATFLCPVWSLRQPPTSRAVIRGFKWMFFRIMWFLTYDKFRRDLVICSTYFTCMNYHYQTRPLSDNSDSREMRLSQLAIYHVFAPCFLILGRRMTIIAGAIGIYSQVSLIYSGDLSLFNWLNIVPCLACFDDRSVSWLLPGRLRRQIAYKQELRQTEGLKTFNLCLGLFIALRGIQVLIRLNEDMHLMNEKKQ
ncbi:lipase maturation factor 1-like [Haliotis rufescens]|uniref:lipase maturation factor 1-like n=1 Tax=Haliotis rufescens TaxID=6454 RepID=UPI00201ECEDE|nr:lipase maturation factor 1-like [Haliotis rufescens]